MSHYSRQLAVFAVAAAALLPVTATQAQTYGGAYTQPAPLYSYAVQPHRPAPGAPNIHVIRQPAAARPYASVHCQNGCDRSASNQAMEPSGLAIKRQHKPIDRALIEKSRKRDQMKRTIINTKKIVRDEPVVTKTRRVVNDPPRAIERPHVVEGALVGSRRKSGAVRERDSNNRASLGSTKKRVIKAYAEITILGPDHMSIQLLRKRPDSKANANME